MQKEKRKELIYHTKFCLFCRSYFRCTHKYDENCSATRQVQQSEQQSDMFEITYFGEHTCKQAKKRGQGQDNSYIINFNPNSNNPSQHFSPPPLSSSIKHEHEEDVMSNPTSSGSITTSPEQQEVPNDFLDLQSINPIDSFSMELDGDSIDFGKTFESILYFDQFGSFF
jgi:WRKY DNA -binding domain